LKNSYKEILKVIVKYENYILNIISITGTLLMTILDL